MSSTATLSPAPAPNPPPASVISIDLKQGLAAEFFIVSFLGFLINALILVVLIPKIKRKAHGDIKLCTFIVITDIFVSIGLFVRSIVGFFPYSVLEQNNYLCNFDLLYTAQLLVFSGYSLGIMSLERFFLICFGISFPSLFWFFIIALTWVPSIILSIIVVISGGSLVGKTKLACTLAPTGLAYVYFIMALVLFFLSFASVIIGYFGIMIIKFKQCLNQINLNIPKDQVYRECRSTITKSFVYIVLYVIVYSGKLYIVVYELTTGKKRTMEWDAISNCMVAGSVIANPIVLLYMNNEVRISFGKFLKQIKDSII